MKLLWLLLGLLLILLGGVFTITIIGVFVGGPLMLIGAIMFFLGLILPIRL